MEQDGSANKMLHLLQQVGGQQDGLLGLQDAQQHLVKILPIEDVVAGKGFVHQNIVRPLAQGQDHFKLILLAGGKAADGLVQGQLEEVHQSGKTLFPEGGEVFPIKIPVGGGGEGGEIGVFTGGKGEPGNIFWGDGVSVQGDLPLISQQAQETLHQGGLARSVLPEQTHDLPGAQGQAYPLQGLFAFQIGLFHII